MPEVELGPYDSADVISQEDNIFSQLTSDVDIYNQTEGLSPFIDMYTTPAFEETSRTIRQAPKEFKAHGEAGDPEIQRGRKVKMSFLDKSYNVKTVYTEDYLEDASDWEINDENEQAMVADNRLMNKLFFIELMRRPDTSTTSNTTGFYYGQEDVPNYQGYVHYGSAHDHYLITDNPTAWAPADFEEGRNHITHHGYGQAGESGMTGGIAFLANTAAMTSISGLTGFTASDSISTEMLRDGYTGMIKGVFLKPVDWVPAGYGIFVPVAAVPLIVLKQHEKAENRGLKLLPGADAADPLQGARHKRIKIGFNTVLKGSGVVMFKGGAWTAQTTLTTN